MSIINLLIILFIIQLFLFIVYIFLLRFDRFDHFRNDFEQIPNQSVVGNFEDRLILILVDSNDQLGMIHSGFMLDGSADSKRHIDLRMNGFSGLADLPVCIHESCIHQRTARSDNSAS